MFMFFCLRFLVLCFVALSFVMLPTEVGMLMAIQPISLLQLCSLVKMRRVEDELR